MRKAVYFLLAAVLCLSVTGCRRGQEPSASVTDAGSGSSLADTDSVTYGEITSWKPPMPELGADGLYRVIVNDYERPADFSPMQARRNMTVTVEKETVHSGSRSAKLICKKEYNSYAAVSVAQPLNLVHRGDFSNLGGVKKISFWVYNAQQKEMDFTALLKLADDGEYTTVTSVPPRQWVLVEIPIDPAKLSDTKNVKYLSFSFQPNIGSDTVFYIDDLCLYRTGK